MGLYGPIDTGWTAHFELVLPSGTIRHGSQQFFGQKPTWQVGESLTLCLLADGKRFFPQALNQVAHLGRLDPLPKR
jgi:hypothetical protein